MIAFIRRHQVLVSSFFCLFLSIYIAGSAARGHLQGDPIGPLLLEAMRPFQLVIRSVAENLSDMRHGMKTLNSLWLENQELKGQIKELRQEVDSLQEAGATNLRLQKLLKLKAQGFRRSVTASVIGNSASTWSRSLTINKGSNNGVRRGMAVISGGGIVGQVVAVASGSSKVLLLTDHNSGVDVIVQRTRARGIVSGSLERDPIMEYVTRNEEIRKGDRLVTSGLGGIFPKGILVGIVRTVRKKSYGLFQDVGVQLAVDPSRIEEVLVVSTGRGPSKGYPGLDARADFK